MKKKLMLGVVVTIAGALTLGGCSSTAPSDNGAAGEDAIEVGFFGFSAANSFAQGTFLGVEDAAEELGANATFIDGQFDGQLQAKQITDAVTSQKYDVIVIQANDNLVVQGPLQQAADAGITVVVEFVAVGPDFESFEPQVDGAISIVDSPVVNGTTLGEMAVEACGEVDGTCKVAYMEGSPALPLDNARTNAVKAAVEAGSGDIELLPTVTGGYSPDTGRTAFQDITQANPDVNVVIGSSQAVAGAYLVAGEGTDIKFIGNGTPQSGVDHVLNGEWFSLYALDIVKNGYTAASYGIKHARGEDVPMSTDERELAPNNSVGTKDALEAADFTSGYDE